MAVYLYVNNRRRARHNIGRVFRDRTNPLDTFSDEEIQQRYRLDRQSIYEVCDLVQQDIGRQTARCRSMSVSIQVMTALRYYASGSFLSVCGDIHGLSKMSTSRCIHSVSLSLCRQLNTYISFPKDVETKRKTKASFYAMAQFPNVLGSIDGTIIPIRGPIHDEYLYMSRKGYHGINVQIINDADLKITNIVAKWPGSTHDSHIWNMCSLKSDFENDVIDDGWLLGDSGYACAPWMLTPVANPQTPSQNRYNRSQKRTRNSSERTIGIWKSRFRCLHKSGGSMMFNPAKCCRITVATAILHNICIQRRIPVDDIIQDDGRHVVYNINHQQQRNGFQIRDNLITTAFG